MHIVYACCTQAKHFINKSFFMNANMTTNINIIIAMHFDNESDKKNSYHISLYDSQSKFCARATFIFGIHL